MGNKYGNDFRYVCNPNGGEVTTDFIKSGKYEIEVKGSRHASDIYLQSPFDPQNKRLHGVYD